MKIAILGAGAMGCLYASYLCKENDVILIGRNKHKIDNFNNHGFTILENNTAHIHRLPAILSGTDIGPVDLVLVFVKSISTPQALSENSNLMGPNTLVLSLQNGAGNDRDMMKFVDSSNIIIGTSKHNSVTLDTGKFEHTASGITTIGGLGNNSKKSTDFSHSIADIFCRCGLETVVSDDIQRIIWSKLFVNITINTLSALLQTPIGYMANNKNAWSFAEKIIDEALLVAEKDGTPFYRQDVLDSVLSVCMTASKGYASMYQDRQNQRLTEVDRLNGAIVKQGKLYGIETPCNSMVVDLIHAVEGTYAAS